MNAIEALLAKTEFREKVEGLVSTYPQPRTALIQALHLCQAELRHVPAEFQAFIAEGRKA